MRGGLIGHRDRVTVKRSSEGPYDDLLEIAVRNGNLPSVRDLLVIRSRSLNSLRGYSLLCSSLQYCHANIAGYLIKIGSAVNRPENDDETMRCRSSLTYTSTPLHLAVVRGYSDIVKMLVDSGADVNAGDETGYTPLHLAVMADFRRSERVRNVVIQCLLHRGASVNALNSRGMTPLHEACVRNSLAVVTRLVGRGASIHSEVSPRVSPRVLHNMSRFQLFTPLHFAVSSGCVKIASYLVRRGAHVVIEDKVSPVHLAVLKADLPMIKTLMEAPFPCLPVLVNLSILSDKQNVLEYLLENGADINPTESLHPLHVAAAAGKASLCDFLLQNGAYIDAKQTLTRDQVREQSRLLCNDILDLNSLSLVGLGKTALHFATKNRREVVVALLLRHGADVDSTDEAGQTALHVACGMKPVPTPIVSSLLRYGTDVNIVDLRDQTIFDVMSTISLTPFQRVITFHLVRLVTAGFHVDARLKIFISKFAPDSSAELLCGKEVTKLRSEEIVGITFYKIFHKSLNEIAVLTKCEEVAKVLKSEGLKARFPMYADMLKARFVKGEHRAKLLDEVPISFHENQGFCLPYLCVRKILDYLNDGDLKKLNDACKRPPFMRIV